MKNYNLKNDQIMKKKIGEKYLQIPSYHKLPIYYESFPFYDRALSRISEKVKEIDSYLNFIDIGANIGDTVSLITDKVDGSFLCIEGDPEYIPFLKDNLANLKKSSIYIEESYCVEDDSQNNKLNIHRENGTARLEENTEPDKCDNLKFKTLDTIIKEYPVFKKTNLLKIDTDGFEIKVLKGGEKFIKENKPIIYFEFDPEMYLFNTDNPVFVFEFLHNHGYHEALVYDNFGIPISIINTSDKEEIKKLISLIDKKKIYYFDVLMFHHSKKENYKKIFENELLSSLSLFDKILDSTKSQLVLNNQELTENKSLLNLANNNLDSTKSQLNSTTEELNFTKSQLESKNIEFNDTKIELVFTKDILEGTKSQLDFRINELNTIYYSRGWRFLMYLRKILNFAIPKESLRRKLISFSYNFSKKSFKFFSKIRSKIFSLFLKIKNYFNKPQPHKRKINRNSKKIVYVSHSYHHKTKSTTFLIDYLKEFFDVEVVLDESWLGKSFPDLSFVDESYLGIIFFQLLPPKEIVEDIKNDNIIYFPMYDFSGENSLEYWSQYKNLKIVNFSKTLHNKLKKWSLESVYLQYFPKISDFISGENREVFFWQRLSHININIIVKLFKNKKVNIHLHKAVDPGQEFVLPTKEQEKKYSITYSDWFETKLEMLDVIKQKGIYIAPREYEGIGMSFLEAMAMGKAVISVDNPTMNEYIENGVNGYLFDLKNPKEIDLSNITQVQKNTYEFMKNGFKEWEKNKKLIIDFIKQ
jgi:FkbM family methyltransferase